MNELFNDFANEFSQQQLLDGAGWGANKISEFVFGFEKVITDVAPAFAGVLDLVYNFFWLLGLSIIITNALKKGFCTYILEKGDNEENPIALLRNSFVAMAIATTAPVLWKYYLKFANMMCAKITELFTITPVVNMDGLMHSTDPMAMAGYGGNGVATLATFVCYVILFYQSVKRGVELVILRAGLPLASCGLLNQDNGVFAQFVKKFAAILFTALVQIALMLLAQAMSAASLNPIWPIAILGVAIAGPKILSELLAPMGGGGGLGKVQSTVMIANSIKSLIK